MRDIHNYKRKLELVIEKVKKSNISKANKKTILDFSDHCFSEGITEAKINRYVFDLHKLAELLKKDFKSANRDDIEILVAKIEKAISKKGKKNYSEWTKQGFRIILKKFYKWLRKTDEAPKEVKWIKTSLKNNLHKLPEDLLTEDEIEKLINSAYDPREKALVAILYESGCRIGEIANIQIKNINFDDYGARVSVNGKTGARVIRLISSVPYLQEWLDRHPDKINPEVYLFVNKNNKQPLSYTRFSVILKRLAKIAKINKRIYPHLFRHSRATYLANKLTEAQLKSVMGWTQSSKQCSTYVHLSGRDTDDAILKIYGIKNNEDGKEKRKLDPKKCTRCEQVNEATNKFCKRCGFILDKEERDKMIQLDNRKQKADEIMDVLLKDKEVQEMLKKKLKQLDVPTKNS